MNKVPTLLGDYCRQRRSAPNTTAVKPLQPLELRVGSSSTCRKAALCFLMSPLQNVYAYNCDDIITLLHL